MIFEVPMNLVVVWGFCWTELCKCFVGLNSLVCCSGVDVQRASKVIMVYAVINELNQYGCCKRLGGLDCFLLLCGLGCFNRPSKMFQFHGFCCVSVDLANSSDTEAPFSDLDMSPTNGIVLSKINDKRDDFNFEIVNFPFLDGDDVP